MRSRKSMELTDALRDDAGRGYVVGAVELSELGWRLQARQVGT